MRDANTPLVVDIAIAGGGIIGLSLGLELRQQGLSVAAIERDKAMSSASWAAGGMLAVNDPQNPLELLPICVVPLRTMRTLQELGQKHGSSNLAATAEIAAYAPTLDATGHRFEWLEEGSLDPNDLREALPAAFCAAEGMLLEGAEVLSIKRMAHGCWWIRIGSASP